MTRAVSRLRRRVLICLAAIGAAAALPAALPAVLPGALPAAMAAEPLPSPAGPVLLTVTGAIAVQNAEGAARFDLAMLEALPQTRFRTSTIWTDGEVAFTGVALADLLARLGVGAGMLRAVAINDYKIDIPVSDAVEGGPMIAYRIDGETMSVRQKGPLWVVYPYDSKAEYRSEIIYARSIWQLDRIIVE
ncbi:molybdopterin-dependent oxidoreductase [Paralimibaculum aggregatum]|uniref:Molybdopterin-dependent oxidoreductase n=1 Tax=Paralimibaculum aggregatum TaxID=3036245 RepID=A0ABQ6LEU0_9RHOB|nr:molybdopterin-dependent oxidoreductase [Limibaculum sp. NKW23]GMG81492.1 molybdopterin-dependent oxidoreductase [Limibaculum sp. NKW23]